MSGPKDGTCAEMTAKEALALLLTKINPQDPEQFTAMVTLARDHVPDGVFADAFGVNKGAIGRFRAGSTLPQPYARNAVRDWLVGMLNSQGATHQLIGMDAG